MLQYMFWHFMKLGGNSLTWLLNEAARKMHFVSFQPSPLRTIRSCGGSATPQEPGAMDLISRLRQLEKTSGEEWEKVSMQEHRRSERAIRNWRVLMEHVSDLMELCVLGVPPCSSFTRPASGSEPFSCLDGASPMQITKASIYAELIQLGEFLGQTRCKTAPDIHMKACAHPLAALAGAGNQAQ